MPYQIAGDSDTIITSLLTFFEGEGIGTPPSTVEEAPTGKALVVAVVTDGITRAYVITNNDDLQAQIDSPDQKTWMYCDQNKAFSAAGVLC